MPLGLISLSVISFFGFTKIAEAIKQKNAPQYCMDIIFCRHDTSDFSKTFTPEYISAGRKYKLFNLSTDAASNKLILEQARKTLNDIKRNHDTVNGIQIVLNDSTSYGDYIKALDNCDEKFPSAFAPYQNQIWACYVNIDTTDIPKEVLNKWRKKYKQL